MAKLEEHPLVLTGPEARAVAEGQKTQHRIPIASISSYVDGRAARKLFAALVWDARVYGDPGPSPSGNVGPYLHVPHRNGETVHRVYPRWAVGDVLWVREPWFPTGLAYALPPEILASAVGRVCLPGIRYEGRGDVTPNNVPWDPARTLPRILARTLLDVVRVRAERVDEVTELDARAGGYPCDLHPTGIDGAPCGCSVSAMRFRQAWWKRNDGAWCWSYDVKARATT